MSLVVQSAAGRPGNYDRPAVIYDVFRAPHLRGRNRKFYVRPLQLFGAGTKTQVIHRRV